MRERVREIQSETLKPHFMSRYSESAVGYRFERTEIAACTWILHVRKRFRFAALSAVLFSNSRRGVLNMALFFAEGEYAFVRVFLYIGVYGCLYVYFNKQLFQYT